MSGGNCGYGDGSNGERACSGGHFVGVDAENGGMGLPRVGGLGGNMGFEVDFISRGELTRE